VVSHTFKMEDWEPDETSYLDLRPVHLWIVPAKLEGSWQLALPGGAALELDLEQTFQKIGGSVTLGPIRAGLREARLRGDAVSFSFVDGNAVLHELTGRGAGDRMEGRFRAGARQGRWSATRVDGGT